MNYKYKTYIFYLVKFRNQNIYIGRTTKSDLNKVKYYARAALPRPLNYLKDKYINLSKKIIIKEMDLIPVWTVTTNDNNELPGINLILYERYKPALNRIRF